MSIILDAQNIKAYYIIRGLGEVKAVDGVSLRIKPNEIVGVIGESGSGKSTLAKVIMLDIAPPLRFVEGSIKIDGMELTKLNKEIVRKEIWGKKISLIPQSAMNAIIPTIKIRKLIRDALKEKDIVVSEKEAIEIALKVFKDLNLPEVVLDMHSFELSGGMRQRVVIALATMLRPSLLIADEPTSALDVASQKLVLNTLQEVINRGYVKSIMFISHDVATVRQIATRIVVMYAGKIVEDANTDDIITEPLHPYTKGLIYSILTPEPEVRSRLSQGKALLLKGEPPSLINPPPGCRFHPRCPFAMDICRKEEPPMIDMGNGRYVSCWLYTKR